MSFLSRLLSRYRRSSDSNDQIWTLGEAVRGERPESLKARADIPVGRVEEVGGLRVHPSSDGITVAPELHADIMGWPDTPEHRRMLATELAARAVLHVRVQ